MFPSSGSLNKYTEAWLVEVEVRRRDLCAVSHTGVIEPTTCAITCCLPGSAIAGNWNWESQVELKQEPWYDHVCANWHSTARPNINLWCWKHYLYLRACKRDIKSKRMRKNVCVWENYAFLFFLTTEKHLILFFLILWHSLTGSGVSPPQIHAPSPPPCSPLQSFNSRLPSTLRSPAYCRWGVSRQCRLSAISLWIYPCSILNTWGWVWPRVGNS